MRKESKGKAPWWLIYMLIVSAQYLKNLMSTLSKTEITFQFKFEITFRLITKLIKGMRNEICPSVSLLCFHSISTTKLHPVPMTRL